MNFEHKLQRIERILAIGEYTIVAKECVALIEHALRHLFTQQLTRLDEKDRLKVQEEERKKGDGKRGAGRFTMGQLVHLFQTSHFLDAWERVSGKDLTNIRLINLDELTRLRNKLVHEGREATRSEAEFLVKCLHIILETFDIAPRNSFSPEPESKTPFQHVDTTDLIRQENKVVEEPMTPSFEVRVWTETGSARSERDIHVVPAGSANTHTLGKTISIHFSATRDCYITLLNIGTSGKLTIIFPNTYVQNNFIRAYHTYTFPGKEYPFDFKLTGPCGTEKIKAIATLKPSTFTAADFSQNGVLRGARPVRDIKVVEEPTKTRILEEWTEDMCTFEVQALE
jgi:hypothetical protein